MTLLHKIDFKRAKKAIKLWLGFAIISLMTLGLVWLTIIFPLSFERFNVAQNIFEQYNLIDTYFTINEKEKNNSVLNPDIVIVDIAGVNNCDSLTEYIKLIRNASPEVIGIDIHFDKLCGCSDTNLVQVLDTTPKLVAINYLTDSIQWNKFRKKQVSFPKCIENPLKSGFSNLVEDKGFSAIYRKFTDYMFYNEDTVKSFASEIAQIAMPDEYKAFVQRKDTVEYIDYTNFYFDKIIAANTNTLSKDDLKNQIVLIGDLTDYKDRVATPINLQMSGVEIHAYILSTIKNGSYINLMPEKAAWILAFFIIMLLIVFKYWITTKCEWLAIFMPMFQLIIILFGIFVGYLFFIKFHYYIPVIQTLIGMAIVGFPYDLYFKILKTIHKHN